MGKEHANSENLIKFSIIIPVYNVERYLNECLDSVLNQSYQNFEILLINDGSTDLSGSICDKYEKQDKRIKAYHQTNQGPLMSRVNAVSKATGDFYLFLDGDDYWDEDLLKTIYETILKYNCDMVIFKYKKISPKGITIPDAIYKDKSVFNHGNKDKLFKKVINSSQLNNLCNKAVKNDVGDNTDYLKYKDISNGEDLLQSLPLMYNAKKIVYIDEPMYNYRKHENSITRTFNIDKFRHFTIVRETVLEYLKKLEMINDENLKNFYGFFITNILKYIRNLINEKIKREKKVKILSQIKNIPLYVSSLKYIDCSLFSLEERIRFCLFNINYTFFLFVYEKSLDFIRRIKFKLLHNKNKQL